LQYLSCLVDNYLSHTFHEENWWIDATEC
jgi:hypothetical protein